jgi:uroporphyrinogen decarboxylase
MKMYKPDFTNLKNVLLCRDKKYVPLIELHIDEGFKEKYLSKKLNGIEDDVKFSLEHCHDFILAARGILKPAKTIGKETHKGGTTWADEDDGIIKNERDLSHYNWMNPLEEDYSVFKDKKKILPEGMKIIATGGKIFTATWMLMGFNNFCISTIEKRDFVKKIFFKVGQIQFEIFKRIIEFDTVGAFAAIDDIAYTEGLMISAEILRENLFPWYKKMGEICNRKNIPFIYHSDGKIWEIIDDLLDCGFNAIHPIEPKAMAIEKVNDKYKGRLCLLGNIEMDTLIRGNKKDVENLVLKNLKNIATDGFYACGASNTITTPMPIENVQAMIDTVRKYGVYPIKIS